MKRAVVIGSGFGGLAAAVRLRALGYEVQVLEAGSQLGGRARVTERDGFRFDMGPTVITAPYLFDELFQRLGRRREDYVTFVPVDPFYRVKFPDGGHFDYVGEEERLLAEIRRIEPRDVDGYLRLARHAQRIFEVGYTRLADQPFSHLSDMLRIVPDLLKLEGHRSVYGLVASYLRDERLRQVFSFEPLLVGGNPMRAPAIYLLIHWLERKWGVHYALGGTGAIVEGLRRLLVESQVELRLGAPVERIDVFNGRARGIHLRDGQYVPADVVVSNADPTLVYSQMLDPSVLRWGTAELAKRRRHSSSLFVSYFGTRRRYPETRHHTILLGPRYRELIEDICQRRVLASDFSLYLHAPGRSDPTMAPEGHDAFYVLSPVPNLASGTRWEEVAEDYQRAIFEVLEQRELPGLREALVTSFSIDPRYFEQSLGSYQGAAFGLEPMLGQSAYFRYHNASPDVPGLYFVGASTHPGAGLPGVLSSAKVLERLLLGAGVAQATKGAA